MLTQAMMVSSLKIFKWFMKTRNLMKKVSISFERFLVSAGSDNTGVATEMASVNSTLKFLYQNTTTFFGVHVTSTPIELTYSQISVASGSASIIIIFLSFLHLIWLRSSVEP